MVGQANTLASSYTTSLYTYILYMPHNLFEGNTYKYILTGINVAPRYKVARPLKTKKSLKMK